MAKTDPTTEADREIEKAVTAIAKIHPPGPGAPEQYTEALGAAYRYGAAGVLARAEESESDPTTTVEVRYKITVQRTAVEVTLKPSEWTVLKQVEEERDSRFVTEESPALTATFDKSGYTPEILTRDVVEREIYSQTVEELDLPALVSVVNGLGAS